MLAMNRQMDEWESRGKRSTTCVYFYSGFTRISQIQYRNLHDLCPQKTRPPPGAALIPPPMLSPRMLPCFQSLLSVPPDPKCPVVCSHAQANHITLLITLLSLRTPLGQVNMIATCRVITSSSMRSDVGQHSASLAHAPSSLRVSSSDLAAGEVVSQNILVVGIIISDPRATHTCSPVWAGRTASICATCYADPPKPFRELNALPRLDSSSS